MRKVSSGGRHIGGSGSRGMSRGGSSRSRGISRNYRSIGGQTNHPNVYRVNSGRTNKYHRYGRFYGNSILPFWARIVFFLILMLLSYIGLS